MPNIALELGKQVSSIGVSASYGDPQKLGDTTLIPVAAAWHGFGAGEDTEGGSGAGGGGYALPLGAYVHRGDDVRFEPNVIALLAVAVPFVVVTGRALARVIRALKK